MRLFHGSCICLSALALSMLCAHALAQGYLQARLGASGFEPPSTTPDQFSARYLRDIATFVQIVRDARIPQQD